MSEALLEVAALSGGYGETIVLREVSFTLEAGRSLAVLGRNGAGKTTLLNTLIGVTTHHAGSIRFAGREIQRTSPQLRAAAGIGWVPQERNIFKSLSVEENMTAVARPGPWNVARVYELFPSLAERRRSMGTQLSGGEQQMLALGRALVLNPRLLLLDEPLEGLSPIVVRELLAAIQRVVRVEGLSSLIVEQHPQLILQVTDQAIVLDRGSVALAASSAELIADPARLDPWLGAGIKTTANP